MKIKWCVTGFLVLILSAGVLLHAQQTASDNAYFEWARAKAEKGDANFQCAIAEIYYTGKLFGRTNNAGKVAEWTKDGTEAAKWFRVAAAQGCAEAQDGLGDCYMNGDGVAKDMAEADKWFRQAAEQGLAAAQFHIGLSYDLGQGVEQDFAQAVKWYRKAAEQGITDAQSNLGAKYGTGEGVSKDYVEAYKWRLLAAARGDEAAKRAVSSLESRMTPDQIAQGQRLAAAFVPRKETPNSSSDNSVSSDNPRFTGTGFFITDDGYLISNYHVVKDVAKVRLLTGTGLIDAAVVKVDAANDLALLKAVGRFAPIPIAASRMVKLGNTVATVGFPSIGLQGFSPKLAKGEIASLSGASDDPRYFQISVPVQPGNSGGALVESHGNVVGIVAAKLNAKAALDVTGSLPENVNYAVKSSLLLSFLESVPDVSAKLKEPNTKDELFEDVVKSAQDAAVLVLVY